MTEQIELELAGNPQYKPKRNVSPLHEELQERSLRWIANRATKIRGGTEVRIGRGYVADAVALGGLQNQHLIRYWAARHGRDYSSPNYRMFIAYFMFVFEIKISKADFKATFYRAGEHRNRLHPKGTLHWVVTPKGMIEPHEVPAFWGLLVASGRGLREIKEPEMRYVDRRTIEDVEHELLWYGNNRTTSILTCPDCQNKNLEPSDD